ncbi:MAG: tetratricopeptide repeat protein [Planctomycetota bacterium]|jgi:DNA-directed RNA polymerase subunit alpha
MGEPETNPGNVDLVEEATLSTQDVENALKDPAPDLDVLMQVARIAQYSRSARKTVEKAVEEMRGRGETKNVEAAVRIGAGLWILGAYREAKELLQNSRTNITGAFFLAQTLVHLRHPAEGAEILAKTVNRKPQSENIRTALVEAWLDAGNAVEVKKALRELEKNIGKSAKTVTLRGRLLDLTGDHEGARELYQKALDTDAANAEALFRLAYSMDLYGDDDKALELYEKCAVVPRPNVNALINLGVLLEDRGEFDRAVECYETILKSYPDHARAQAFLKDALSSLVEVVDEERERLEDRRWQTLQIPITDFELSVRSRNCLNKMNISTLGDLVQKTEVELLSYKNFGETSLGESKVILESKNLRLGINLDEIRRGERRQRFDELFQKGKEDDEVALKPINELGLSIRSRKCMEVLTIDTIGDLMGKSEKELLACKNFGQTSLLEVKRKLAEHGVSLSEDASDGEAGEGSE